MSTSRLPAVAAGAALATLGGLLPLFTHAMGLPPRIAELVPGRSAQAVRPKALVQINYAERGYGLSATRLWGSYRGNLEVNSLPAGRTYDLLAPTAAFRPGEYVNATLVWNQPIEGTDYFSARFHVGAAAGTGAFGPATPLAATPELPGALAAADVDADGRVDVAARTATNVVTVYRNSGVAATPLTVLDTVRFNGAIDAVAFGDFDNDGDPDLVAASGARNAIRFYENNGSGGYTLRATRTAVSTTIAAPLSLDVVDRDGDETQDVIVANPGSGSLTQLSGDGAFGFFSSPLVSAPGGSLRAVRLADWYGNGRFGYATIDATANALKLGARDNGFVLRTATYALGASPVAMEVVDFSADGHADVLVLLANGNLRLLRGTGNGTLTVGAPFAGGLPGAAAMTLADVDADGDDDVLLGAPGSATLRVLRNDGTGTFSGQDVALGATLDVAGLLALDFDNDGALDIVTADTRGGATELALLTNGLAPVLDLVVSTPEAVQGSYRHVTVTGTGIAFMEGGLSATGTFVVQGGGTLFTQCAPITGAGTFTLEDGATIRICDQDGIRPTGPLGAVRVLGARTFSDGATYEYSGTDGQVTGAALPLTVRNLTSMVIDGGTLHLTRALTVREVLRLEEGGFLALGNNNLTLRSDAAGTALVVQPDGGGPGPGTFSLDGTGRVLMQRYITPVGAYTGPGYRHYSSPMTAAPLADLAVAGTFVPRVDPAYNALPTPTTYTAATFPNVFGYEQDRLTAQFPSFNTGWYCPGSLAETMAPGTGYTVRIPAAATVDLVGQPNVGEVAVPLHYGPLAQQGWNLVGNPYPAPLDVTLFTADGSDFGTPTVVGNVDQSISVFRPTSAYGGVYRTSTFEGVGTLPGGLVPAMQGFFVRAHAPDPNGNTNEPVMTFTHAVRVTEYANPAFARSTTPAGVAAATSHPAARPLLRLTLTGPDATIGTDETVVYGHPQATAAPFDRALDAAKIMSTGLVPSVFTRLTDSGEALAVNALPLPGAAPVRVPLDMVVGQAGRQLLAVTELVDFDNGEPVVLEDHLLGTEQVLTATTAYPFQAAAGALDGRFTLRFGPATVTGLAAEANAALAVWPNPAAAGAARHVLVSDLPLGTAATLVVRTVLGREVQRLPLTGTEAVLPAGALAPGVYVLSVEAAGRPTRSRRLVVTGGE